MLNTFLITGGAGFIGSHFIRHVYKAYPRARIINVDALSYAADLNPLNTLASSERYRLIKEDIQKAQQFYSSLEQADCVIHFAAQTHVDRSFKEIDQFIAANVTGTERLVEAARSCKNIKRFIHISTDEVYGPIVNGYAKEADALKPTNPYSKTKARAEKIVTDAIAKGFPAIIVRPSNNFGPNQHVEKFIPKIITNALNHFSIPIYGNGHYYREWIYVDDCVRAIDLILREGVIGEVYNAGSNNIWCNLDLVKRILKHCDRGEDLIEFVEDRPDHDKRYAMDCTKIEKLGFKIESDFDYCLLRTIEYYLERNKA